MEHSDREELLLRCCSISVLRKIIICWCTTPRVICILWRSMWWHDDVFISVIINMHSIMIFIQLIPVARISFSGRLALKSFFPSLFLSKYFSLIPLPLRCERDPSVHYWPVRACRVRYHVCRPCPFNRFLKSSFWIFDHWYFMASRPHLPFFTTICLTLHFDASSQCLLILPVQNVWPSV